MEEQDRLLDTASAVVREQAFFMKKAIEQENLRDALKYSSNMLSELKTSQLSPRYYYELYMLIFQELQNLGSFFSEKSRHGRKLAELYESVQHAGNILPRLFLLVTVGIAYIQSREAPGVEILRDMAELCKGIQHPIRGLFLRYYLLQMTKDKLQFVVAEEPNGLEEVTDFIISNFSETTRLWIRLSGQSNSVQRDRVKRERERHDLRILVGASLVRLSQLEGMTRSFYTEKVLPRVLELVIQTKDTMAQQYLLDCTVQVFPDEFHLASLSAFLSACSKTQRQVDLRPVLINLMNRLKSYLQSNSKTSDLSPAEVFALFRLHLEKIMHRATTPSPDPSLEDQADEDSTAATTGAAVVSAQAAASKACGSMLELFQAFLGFTLSLDKNRFDQVSVVHGMALAALDKYTETATATGHMTADDRAEEENEEPAWLYPLTEIVESTVRVIPLSAALALSQFGSLLSAVPKRYSKKVAVAMIDAVLDEDSGVVDVVSLTSGELAAVETVDKRLSDPTTVTRFLSIIEPLLVDTVQQGSGSEGEDQLSFQREQDRVCKMVHLCVAQDLDSQFDILNILRSSFGIGGPKRLAHTLPTLLCAAESLAVRLDQSTTTPKVTLKKVFQFMHSVCSALVTVSPLSAFKHWLSSALLVDRLMSSEKGYAFEPIMFEFYSQALITFEEELTDGKVQYEAVVGLVGVLVQSRHLSGENYEVLATKTTQHAVRLLKRADQCRAVLGCSHLFHSQWQIKDPKRVLECLQRGLKIADILVQSAPLVAHELFVECLNKYLYYYGVGLDEIAPMHITNLIALCQEHAQFASSQKGEENAAAQFLNRTLQYLAWKRSQADGHRYAVFKANTVAAPQVVDGGDI